MTAQQSGLKLVLIGAGGHAGVIIKAVRAAGPAEIAALVDAAPAGKPILAVPVLGGSDVLPGLRAAGFRQAVVPPGQNAVRQRMGETLRRLGEGVVMARAVVRTEATVGNLATVNTAASVDRDNVIDAAAHVAPDCALAGNLHVGARAPVGVGSAVRPGIRIGDDAVVGAGSAVVSDIADKAVVGRAPARPLPWRSAA